MLTPQDVRSVQFEKNLRGYRTEDVDRFLDKVEQQLGQDAEQLSLIHISFDGMSIARAVVEHISDPAKGLGCKTLFATHYHELTDLEGAIAVSYTHLIRKTS